MGQKIDLIFLLDQTLLHCLATPAEHRLGAPRTSHLRNVLVEELSWAFAFPGPRSILEPNLAGCRGLARSLDIVSHFVTREDKVYVGAVLLVTCYR
jgi:hypothetical protein